MPPAFKLNTVLPVSLLFISGDVPFSPVGLSPFGISGGVLPSASEPFGRVGRSPFGICGGVYSSGLLVCVLPQDAKLKSIERAIAADRIFFIKVFLLGLFVPII